MSERGIVILGAWGGLLAAIVFAYTIHLKHKMIIKLEEAKSGQIAAILEAFKITSEEQSRLFESAVEAFQENAAFSHKALDAALQKGRQLPDG